MRGGGFFLGLLLHCGRHQSVEGIRRGGLRGWSWGRFFCENSKYTPFDFATGLYLCVWREMCFCDVSFERKERKIHRVPRLSFLHPSPTLRSWLRFYSSLPTGSEQKAESPMHKKFPDLFLHRLSRPTPFSSDPTSSADSSSVASTSCTCASSSSVSAASSH